MSLLTYTAPSKTVSIGTPDNPNSVVVEGLNANRIALLVQSLRDDLEALFNLATLLTKTDLKSVTNIDLELGRSFFEAAVATPTVLSTLIAICVTGEDEGQPVDMRIAAVNRMPLSVQSAVMSAILELTFSEVGAIKKLIDQFASARANLSQS